MNVDVIRHPKSPPNHKRKSSELEQTNVVMVCSSFLSLSTHKVTNNVESTIFVQCDFEKEML